MRSASPRRNMKMWRTGCENHTSHLGLHFLCRFICRILLATGCLQLQLLVRLMIAILVPSRKRVEQCKRMIQSVIDTSKSDISIYLGIDDIDEYREVAFLANERVAVHRVQLPDGMPTAHKWNLLAEMALRKDSHKLFMLGSDDIIFSTPLWDRALIDDYSTFKRGPHVYHFQDSRDENGTPHPIVTREYIEAMGYFVPPIFLHWFIDSWTVAIARANDCFTHLKDFLLVHSKPSDFGKADETHTKIRAMGWHDRDKWVNDRCQNLLRTETARLLIRRTVGTEGNWVA